MKTIQEHTERVEALIEALPFIQKYRGKLFVIKYGGSAMEDETAVERLLRDLVFLEAVGINPVLIHGGGKAISSRMREAGLKPVFVNGLRVTDQQSIEIVETTLDHVINPRIVSTINEFGGKAIGISGKEVLSARKLPLQNDGKKQVDIGFVGEVESLTLDKVREAIAQETVPVVSPISRDPSGVVLNVNADEAAGRIAGALGAAKLIYISDVLGIMRDPKDPESLIPTVSSGLIEQLINEEVIEGGMIPKVRSALGAISEGVAKVHFIDGRIPHSILMEVFTTAGIGTEIVS